MAIKVVYSAKELAEIVEVDPQTVRRWIRDGEVKAHKIGRKWFITEEEFKRITSGRGR